MVEKVLRWNSMRDASVGQACAVNGALLAPVCEVSAKLPTRRCSLLVVDDALHNEDVHVHVASNVFEMSAAVRVCASVCELEVSIRRRGGGKQKVARVELAAGLPEGTESTDLRYIARGAQTLRRRPPLHPRPGQRTDVVRKPGGQLARCGGGAAARRAWSDRRRGGRGPGGAPESAPGRRRGSLRPRPSRAGPNFTWRTDEKLTLGIMNQAKLISSIRRMDDFIHSFDDRKGGRCSVRAELRRCLH